MREHGFGLAAELPPSVGLAANEVEIRDHDPAWRDVFALVESGMRRCLNPAEAGIEHVGSTAVPGLPAKPIVDVAVGLRRDSGDDQVLDCLVDQGYAYRGDFGLFGGRLFVLETTGGLPAVHVHVVGYGDDQWRRYLAFRDGLRADNDLAKRYAAIKTRLAADNRLDRRNYTDGKFEFVFANAQRLELEEQERGQSTS